MKNYKHIMVMGAGGVGGYFGGRLAEHSSAHVILIARGAHLRAIQKNGLRIKSIDGDATVKVEAFEDPAKVESADLVLFTVKSYDTPVAIEQIRPVVGANTQILTIQNGVENYAQLVEAYGQERVIQGFCKIGVGVAEPGVINHKAFGEITVGEQDGTVSSRLKKLKRLCDEAGIALHISSEIDRNVWLKFAWNGVFNMLTAAGNVTVEKLFNDEKTIELCYSIFTEIRKVAEAEGVNLTVEDGENMIKSTRSLKGFTTSTYQDRQKGKRMEFEAFTGAIVHMAKRHDIDIPHNQTLYALLVLIDQNIN